MVWRTLWRNSRSVILVPAVALLCAIMPAIGVGLRDSTSTVLEETEFLRSLRSLPVGFDVISTLLAWVFSGVGCVIIMAVLAYVAYRHSRSIRKVVRNLIVSISPTAYVTGVKQVVERPRPSTSVGSSLLPSDPSFPSGHTAGAVMVATMGVLMTRSMKRHIRHAVIIIGVLLVAAVGFSRLVLGLHFPTDVLTSILVCPAISYALWYLFVDVGKRRTR
ncbi:phosphatase PAP2 family protein [Bifidobacterium callimiconis]|uniref:phosphatase PAP2 family protein n=1 Tax=Bifidobacterium callimiconis TaxID=2306973 RepID=UPI001BDC384F|nr:phosphatase PAP2 family protein [Bifidobacterium callimiconis]MBT1178001.1 phosphatase PAP2 family protein [Bifidobacterium callimiconis]